MRKRQVERKKRLGQFHLHIDEDILERLKAVARKEGRAMAELVREAMADLLKKRECNKGVK
jgi:predicted DNA-binding protein